MPNQYERIDLGQLNSTAVKELVQLLPTKHRFQGAAVQDGCAILGFQLPPDLARQFRGAQIPQFRVFPNFCLGTLGASIGFKSRFKDCEGLACVFVNRDDAVFQSLITGKVRAIFFQNREPIYAFQVDCSQEHAEYANRWNQVADHEPLIEDGLGHYWELLTSFREQLHLDFVLSKAEKVTAGWVEFYQGQVQDLASQIENLHDAALPGLIRDDMPHSLKELLRVVRDSGKRLAPVHEYVQESYGADDQEILQLYAAGHALFRDEQTEAVGVFVHELVGNYFISSSQTDCGRCIRWFDSVSGRMERLAVDVGHFPANFDPDNYWKRVIWELPHNWGHIVKGSEVPIHPQQVAKFASELPQADDIAHVELTANLLMDEALAGKRFTIPPAAVVDFPFGAFSTFQIRELGSAVVFKFRNLAGEFYVASVFREIHACTFTLPISDQGLNEGKKAAIEAGVKLFLAAVIRDFWVVEERETIFGSRPAVTALHGNLDSDEGGPRIVYLPRIKYTRSANTTACGETLGHQERRSHFVSGHIRRAEHASPAQIILAERHGREIPLGYTFVRPHERGRGVRDVIYRSRSALHSLYTAVPAAGIGEQSDWFQFERDVHALMVALGFTVEHVSASRRGDGGVDLFATKGQDLNLVNWVIQCKCYGKENKVGPGIVRELAGTIGQYPSGTRGMIVTTSSFTPKAIEEAQRVEIRLMDGVEFRGLQGGQ